MRTPRFHVPEAAPGARVHLPEIKRHHAKDVLRLRTGDAVRLFDGRGNEFDGVLEEVSRRTVCIHVGGATTTPPEAALPIRLALSPLKGDLMELVIQKVTELGVHSIHPVVMERTDPVARRALVGSRQERWEKVAASAAEQCGRATVPAIAPTVALAGLSPEPSSLRIVFVTEDQTPPLSSLPSPEESVMLVVGPAGGLAPTEIALLTDKGFRPASLGTRVLRAETAAIASVVAAQVLWGDLGR